MVGVRAGLSILVLVVGEVGGDIAGRFVTADEGSRDNVVGRISGLSVVSFALLCGERERDVSPSSRLSIGPLASCSTASGWSFICLALPFRGSDEDVKCSRELPDGVGLSRAVKLLSCVVGVGASRWRVRDESLASESTLLVVALVIIASR